LIFVSSRSNCLRNVLMSSDVFSSKRFSRYPSRFPNVSLSHKTIRPHYSHRLASFCLDPTRDPPLFLGLFLWISVSVRCQGDINLDVNLLTSAVFPPPLKLCPSALKRLMSIPVRFFTLGRLLCYTASSTFLIRYSAMSSF